MGKFWSVYGNDQYFIDTFEWGEKLFLALIIVNY